MHVMRQNAFNEVQLYKTLEFCKGEYMKSYKQPMKKPFHRKLGK